MFSNNYCNILLHHFVVITFTYARSPSFGAGSDHGCNEITSIVVVSDDTRASSEKKNYKSKPLKCALLDCIVTAKVEGVGGVETRLGSIEELDVDLLALS